MPFPNGILRHKNGGSTNRPKAVAGLEDFVYKNKHIEILGEHP